jgi:hypothetical protein
MVMTVLEGEVSEKKVPILLNEYKEAVKQLEPGMVTTYLVHDMKNPKIWRIITVWESKEVLEKMRSLGTPKGILMFRAAGSEPKLSLYEVHAQASK